MSLNLNEIKLHQVMDRLSNDEPVAISEDWIDQAVEGFRKSLKRQLLDREPRTFKLRMSNLGKPLCQLQMEKAGSEKTRKPYNHIMRMIIGDAVESVTEILLKAAKVDVTGTKTKVQMTVADTEINGEDDLHIDGKVYDIKSCSDWAFKNKWSKGVEGLIEYDDFGYLSQGVGYAEAQKKDLGGWIVVNKSTGEVLFVEADLTKGQVNDQLHKMSDTVSAIVQEKPFERCFDDKEEFFRKEPTGNRVLSPSCSMCDFARTCWPNALMKPQAMSKAKDRKMVWYTEYHGDD